MKKPRNNVLTKEFELQIVVIGILLAACWQLPQLITPITLGGEYFTLQLIQVISIIIGIFWAITLIAGTFYLAFKDYSLYVYFNKLFKISITITIALSIFVILAYMFLFYILKII